MGKRKPPVSCPEIIPRFQATQKRIIPPLICRDPSLAALIHATMAGYIIPNASPMLQYRTI